MNPKQLATLFQAIRSVLRSKDDPSLLLTSSFESLPKAEQEELERVFFVLGRVLKVGKNLDSLLAELEPHVGSSAHRTANNPEEKRFAEAWTQSNRFGNTLAHLLNEKGWGRHSPEPTKRDRFVAATVVQWLGSPVGQAFLHQLGYRRESRA